MMMMVVVVVGGCWDGAFAFAHPVQPFPPSPFHRPDSALSSPIILRFPARASAAPDLRSSASAPTSSSLSSLAATTLGRNGFLHLSGDDELRIDARGGWRGQVAVSEGDDGQDVSVVAIAAGAADRLALSGLLQA